MKRIMMMIWLSLLMLLSGLSVQAEEIPEVTLTGTMNLTFTITDTVNGNEIDTVIPGASFRVYKVWYYDEENNVHVLDKFSRTGVTINTKEMSGDDIQRTKDAFLKVVEEDGLTPDYVFTTDANGEFHEEMVYGGYLFILDKPVIVDDMKITCEHFLGFMPEGISNIESNPNVELHPKAIPQAEILPQPPIEKKVNGVDHYVLKERYEVVTYSITTKIPLFGTEFIIFDTLEPVLEFEPGKTIPQHVTVQVGNTKLTTAELLDKNKVNGVPRVAIKDKTITVDVSDWVQDHRDEPVVITFRAKIINGADLSKYVDEVIPNHATYSIDNKYTLDSNVVTIVPPKPKKPTPPTPFTGDNFHVLPYAILLVVAIVAGIFGANKLRKSK